MKPEKKNTQINFRITTRIKEDYQRAAEMLGQTLTAFMKSAIHEKMLKTFKENINH